MIIGAILEISNYTDGSVSSGMNGSAMLTFYTMTDAINWAVLQSDRVTYGTANQNIFSVCTITNTETNQKRWWYNGIEYTA